MFRWSETAFGKKKRVQQHNYLCKILKIIKSGKYMEENWTIKKLGKNNWGVFLSRGFHNPGLHGLSPLCAIGKVATFFRIIFFVFIFIVGLIDGRQWDDHKQTQTTPVTQLASKSIDQGEAETDWVGWIQLFSVSDKTFLILVSMPPAEATIDCFTEKDWYLHQGSNQTSYSTSSSLAAWLELVGFLVNNVNNDWL